MAKLIRKITVGKDYKENAMHYAVGQEVYGGHTISDIIEEDDKYSIYIRKEKNVLPWKDFNKNMAISIEYDFKLFISLTLLSIINLVIIPLAFLEKIAIVL